jgi:hypothetical protein
MGSMDSKDSGATDFKDASVAAAAYWLQTVMEDRAESAQPPVPVEAGTAR